MAKPYLIFKAHTGFYYAQIRLADGTLSNNKSTGCKNRAEAERKVMEWIVTGNIPSRVGSKDSKVKSIDKIRLFNDLRTAEFDSDDINNIIKILKETIFILLLHQLQKAASRLKTSLKTFGIMTNPLM